MSNEDSQFGRIAPGFLWRNPIGQPTGSEFAYPDEKSGMLRQRWNKYRDLFEHSDVKLGIDRDKWGDAFIMVDSVGLLNRGHTSGYLFCAEAPPVDANRFEPCNLHQDHGEQKFSPEARKEGYSFLRLDSRWFAFDQGPS